jgi:hypothetical protein
MYVAMNYWDLSDEEASALVPLFDDQAISHAKNLNKRSGYASARGWSVVVYSQMGTLPGCAHNHFISIGDQILDSNLYVGKTAANFAKVIFHPRWPCWLIRSGVVDESGRKDLINDCQVALMERFFKEQAE